MRTKKVADTKYAAVPRRIMETLAWALLIIILWGTDLLAKLGEYQQSGIGKQPFFLLSEQATSALSALIMILFIVYWSRLFPLKFGSWPTAVIGHTVGTVLFAFGHYTLMVLMRVIWYHFYDHDYIWRSPFAANLVVEYQKDIKVYLGALLILALYRRYQKSRSMPKRLEQRLVVQTGRGERILRFSEIDYLEAARNYVGVHSGQSEYLVRDTMANIVDRLADGPFARVHRSYVVNTDKVEEIRTVDGKRVIFMDSGESVPLGRNYRSAFLAQVSGQSTVTE